MSSDESGKTYTRKEPTTEAEKFASKFGDRSLYDESFEREVIARGRGAIGSRKLAPKPSKLFSVTTTQTPLSSDIPDVGSILSLTRRATGTSAELIGFTDPNNLLLFPITHAGLVNDDMQAQLRVFFQLMADKIMDEHFGRILLFDSLGPKDCYKTISDDRAEWVYRITSTAAVNKNLQLIANGDLESTQAVKDARAKRALITSASTLADAQAADAAIVQAIASWVATERARIETLKAEYDVILAVPRSSRTAVQTATFDKYLKGPKLYFDIPIDLIEKSESAIIAWFSDKKFIDTFLDKARDYQTFPALFFAVREQFRATHGLANTIRGSIEGEQVLSGKVDWNAEVTKSAKDVTGDSSLTMLANATGVQIPTDLKGNVTFQPTTKSIALRDVMYKLADKQDDDISKVMMAISTSLKIKVPTWFVTHAPQPIWTDKELWSCTGIGATPEAVAVRIFLFHVFRTFAKIQYYSYRNDTISVTFTDKTSCTMKDWFDKLVDMDQFDTQGVSPKFWDDVEKTMDLGKLMKTYASYRSMKFVFESPEGTTFQHFGLWDETLSQLPELFEGFYFLDELYAVANLSANERHLITMFKKHTTSLKDAAVKVFGLLKKAQPVFSVLTNTNTNVLESLATAGILFGQNFEITHFGTYAGSFPLYADGIIFGKPKIKPLLLSHYGFDDKAWVKEIANQKWNAVFARSKVGLLTHSFTDDFKVVRIKDVLDQQSIPKEIATYLGLGGRIKDDSFVLLSDINLKDIIFEDAYLGSAGYFFKSGGH